MERRVLDSGRIHLIAPGLREFSLLVYCQIHLLSLKVIRSLKVAKGDRVTNVNLRGPWLLMFGF